MRRRISLAAGVGVMLAAVACSSGAPLRSPSHQRAATGIPALANRGACAAFTVRRQGRLLASGVVGVPATTSTALFDMGSAAKSITAAAVLLLAQEHRVSLSASIDRYLRDVPGRDRSITMAQLLTHTSGIPENFTGDQTQLSRADAVRAILRLPRHRPGHFAYSNAGYTLLAAIVETVSGRPYREFVEERLLRPAGMTTTGWYGAPPPAAATPIQGHVRGRETGAAGTQAPSSWATPGAGGMVSTAADMDRWLTALTSYATLTPKTTQVMFAPRVSIGQPGADAAYGWITGTTPDGVIHLIGGQTDYGYTSDLRILPETSLTSVALSCSDSTPAAELGHQIEAKYA